MDIENQKLDRGFRLMSIERRREIAAMGGRAAHAKRKAHRFTSEEAKEAVIKRHDKKA